MHRTSARIILTILMSLMMQSPNVLAEETGSGSDVTTESERTLTAVLTHIRTTLADESDATITATAADPQLIRAWQEEAKRLRERQRAHRRSCTTTLYGTGESPSIRTITQCVRSDLTQEALILRKQLTFLTSLPIRDATTRHALITSHAALIGAVSAITDGMDADLFRDIDLLQKALRNLHERYRRTVWQQRTYVELERERAWVLTLMEKLTVIEDNADTLYTSALCLEQAAQTIQTGRLAPNGLLATQALLHARSQLTDCRTQLRNTIYEKMNNIFVQPQGDEEE